MVLACAGIGRRGMRRNSSLASPQNATNWARIWPAMERSMFSQMQGELPRFLIDAQNSPTYARAKKLLLVLLALWMTYFLVVNWFAHKLNKIAVPVLEIPLGTYLTVQGAAIVFAV